MYTLFDRNVQEKNLFFYGVAAAITLVIEFELFNKVKSAVLHAVFTDLNFNIRNSGLFRCSLGGSVDLIEVFPARSSKDRGNGLIAAQFGIFHYTFKAHFKTYIATPSALRLIFEPLGQCTPTFVIVLQLNKIYAIVPTHTLVFITPFDILRLRTNIGVIKHHDKICLLGGKFFNNSAGTRRTT